MNLTGITNLWPPFDARALVVPSHYHIIEGVSKQIHVLEGPSKQIHILEGPSKQTRVLVGSP